MSISEEEDDMHADDIDEREIIGDGNLQSDQDGFANMMSKILSQRVDGKVPLLSKRKTPIMRELEERSDEKKKLKKKGMEKKAQRERQMQIPDVKSSDVERQLRRLATRGVVTLFNAIAKSKRDAAEEKEKGTKENDEDLNSHNDVPAHLPSSVFTTTPQETSACSSKDKDSKWKALKDDLAVEKSLRLKDWDKDSSSSEGEED